MSRDTLKNLIDVVEESELETIYRVLIRFVDENTLTPDEEEALRTSMSDFARGEVYTHEEAWA